MTSSKLEQVLTIDPPYELSFTGPFTSAVSSLMKLKNPSEAKVCFKIKTTAPKRYCVKPNSGVIDPGCSVEIAVSLQPFEYDPQEKNRHKFMVQSMFAPEGEINQDTLWKELDPSQLMDSKLKCLFIMPDDNNSGSDSNKTIADQFKSAPASSTASPKAGGTDPDLRKSVEEIKKLQEEVSALRQENIQLKEETLRQKRLASTNRNEAESSSYSSTMVTATAPDQNALSTTYLYAALIILILGVIIGKWII